jgi:DNA-binding transcriptional LysR family regulator
MTRVSVSGLSALRIRHLQLVESLVELGSLPRAAQAMDLTESSAAAMLREVEAVFWS